MRRERIRDDRGHETTLVRFGPMPLGWRQLPRRRQADRRSTLAQTGRPRRPRNPRPPRQLGRLKRFVRPLLRGGVVAGVGGTLLICLLIGLTLSQGPLGLGLALMTPASVPLILLTAIVLRQIGEALESRAERIRNAMLVRGRCASCAYGMAGLEPAEDGCVLCPECGAAWRAERLHVADTERESEVVVVSGFGSTHAPV